MACLTLAVLAVRWRVSHASRESAYRFLLPINIAAGLLGIILVYPYAMEIFVAWYSGAMFEMEMISYRFNGPYGWAYYAGFILPLLPLLGWIPLIGKRPLLMLGIAALALIPVSFTPVVNMIQWFTARQ